LKSSYNTIDEFIDVRISIYQVINKLTENQGLSNTNKLLKQFIT